MHLTQAEYQLLTRIRHSKRFPIAQFCLRSSKEASLRSVALSHVSLRSPDDSMEQIKSTAALLADLQRRGLVRLCYHLPVSARSDFQIFYDSKVFKQLCRLVVEGAKRPGFLFDRADIKRGVVTVTALGRKIYLDGQ